MRTIIMIISIFFGLIASSNFTLASLEKPEIFPQLGHADRVQSVVFSPDGKFVLSGGLDNTLRLWDLKSEREIRRFNGHTDGVRTAVFSPDGRLALSGGRDKTLRLWDVNTGKEVRRFTGHSDAVLCAAFSPDGKLALSSSADKALRLWNINTGRTIRTFVGHADEIYSTVFSPDGKFVLSGSTDKTVRLWNVKTGKETRKFSGHENGVYSVAFSPDGRLALSGSEDKTVRLWDVASGKELRKFEHEEAIFTVSFSPNGKFVISAGMKGDVTLWELNSGGKAMLFAGNKWPVYSAAFSPDGRLVVSGGFEKNVRIWDVASGKEAQSLGQPNYVFDAAFSQDGKMVLTGNSDKTICLWDALSGKKLRTFAGHNESVHSVVFSPDGKFVLSGSLDRTARLWDVATGAELRRFEGNSLNTSTAFSPDGRYLLLPTDYYAIHLWDLVSGKKIKTIEHKSAVVSSVAFSPDGKSALSTGENYVSLWNLSTGKEIRRFNGHTHTVCSAVFSPDGKFILAGGSDHVDGSEYDFIATMRLWDVSSGKEILKFTGQANNRFDKVAISPDGRIALSGSQDKGMRLWDLNTGKELRLFAGHSTEVTSVVFSPDERFAMSASSDGTARLWEINSGKETVQFIYFTGGEWVVITPEGFYNASENGDRYLNVRVGSNVYGIGNYRETFFRPDLVKMALAGGSLKDYRTLADVKQPPKVSIVQTPASSSTEGFKLTLRLDEQGGGIGDVRLFLNGSAVMLDNGRGLKVVQKNDKGVSYRSYTLKLSPGSNSIRVVAFNSDNSMQSNDATHQVTASFTSTRKPTLHALVIGIQEFRNPKLALKYAVADANLFAETLRMGATGLFEQIRITTLTAREATTRDGIVSALQQFKSINPDDLFILYIASHGTVDDGEYFMITSNVGALSTQRLKNDALSQLQLKEMVANIPSTKKLIVIDTCNAAALGDAIQAAMLTRGMSEDTAMKVLSRAVGSTILSASTSVQEALEGYQGHGLFTWAVTQGMQGKADKGGSGFVKTTDLAAYVEDEVPNLAERIFKRSQFPTVSISGQGFPVGKVK